MKIDRTLFLVLTGSLAGAGCEVYVNEHPKPPPAAPAAATPVKPAVVARQQPPAPPAPPSKVVPLRRLAGGGAAPTPSGGGTTPPAPSTCLDTGAATIPDCGAMQAADSSCAPFPFPQQKCSAYKTYFDPKVAAVAVSCMTALNGKQVCDGSQSYNCGKAALVQACPDSTLAQLCAIAATSCKSTASDCTALLSGLNDQGKDQVAQCIAQGCSAGLYSCIEGLTSSAAGASKGTRH